MKKLMLFLALTASVWSSFSLAVTTRIFNFNVASGYSGYIFDPIELYVPCSRNDDSCIRLAISEMLSVTHNGTSITLTACTTSTTISVSPWICGQNARLTYSLGSQGDVPETRTCKSIEGAFIDGYHNSLDDFCAIVGSTGGANPEPLLCVATNISEIPSNSGNFQHTVTQQACSAPTGPTAPDGEGPDPEPCTENCEPTDPETPPGGDDGSGIPDSGGGATGGNSNVGGTITDSDGKVTNIDLTIEQDFTPVTERLNETNDRLAVENKNSANLVEKVDALGRGLIEANDNLEGIKDAIAGIETGGDMSGVEGKLDGIQESIDAIKDGFGTAGNGESAADAVNLPNYQEASDKAYNKVMETINTGEGQAYADRISNIGDELTAFESIPQLFDLAQDSCAPIPLGKHSLNLCPYAPTISTVLTWIAYMLTLIFLVRSVHAQLQNVRLT